MTAAATQAPPQARGAARAGRIAGTAGLIFGVLSLLGIASIGHFPNPAQDGSEFAAFLSDHRSSILTTNVLLSLANGALLVFFAYLRTLLSAGARIRALPTLAFAAAVLLCAIGAGAAMLPASLAYYGTTGIDPTLVRLMISTYFAANAFSAMPVAVAIGAIGLTSLPGTILPRWFALASIAAATLQLGATFTLLGSGNFSPHGAYGTTVLFGSLTIWTLTGSVLLLTRTTSHQPGTVALTV